MDEPAPIALPFHQELARSTLEALAEMQATEWDDWRDAEPGKILHELRRGTLAATGQIPHSPYYGAHDTTPLFLIALDEYERWSGDVEFVRRLQPNARAALAWLEGPADLDGDGYIAGGKAQPPIARQSTRALPTTPVCARRGRSARSGKTKRTPTGSPGARRH